MNDTKILDNAINLFEERDGELSLKTSFFTFSYGLKKIDIENDAALTYLLESTKHFTSIFNNLWNISIIFERLEWVKYAYRKGILDERRATSYFKVDIITFHTELRASLDYITKILSIFSKQNGQVTNSFDKLRKRVNNYTNKLDLEIINLIKNANWFNEFRSVRNALIHLNGEVITMYGIDEGIGFQITDHKQTPFINKPFLKHDVNTVIFEKYAALYFTYFLNLIEDFGVVLQRIVPKNLVLMQMYIHGPGLPVIHHWIKCLNAEIQKDNLRKKTQAK